MNQHAAPHRGRTLIDLDPGQVGGGVLSQAGEVPGGEVAGEVAEDMEADLQAVMSLSWRRWRHGRGLARRAGLSLNAATTLENLPGTASRSARRLVGTCGPTR